MKIINLTPGIKGLKKEDLYGKPSKPKGLCTHCRRLFELSELQEIRIDPDKKIFLCPKCYFRYSFRKKLGEKY